MVDPVSNEGIQKAIEKTGVDGAGEAGRAEKAPSGGEASFDEIFKEKAGEVERVENRDLEAIDDLDSATATPEGGDTGLDEFVEGISDRKSEIDEMLQRTMDGKQMDQKEMLEMQMLVYKYSQKVELASKTVEKATGGLKQMMQVQV